MSRQSQARKKARAMKAAGVSAVARGFLPIEHVTAGSITTIFETTLEHLVEIGGDVTGRLRVDIGAHPEYPGRTTIEIKAERSVETHEGDCSDPRCPLDHSLDRLDS